MTPYELGILLHYRASALDHPDMARNLESWRQTIDRFVEWRLLQPKAVKVSAGPAWVLTARGHAFVDALEQLPLPEEAWVMRWPKGER